MRISVLSHSAGRPVTMVQEFREVFEMQQTRPLEVIIVEREVWSKAEMVNEAARQASGDWYFVTDIDNRFGSDVVARLSEYGGSGNDAVFLKNVMEVKEGSVLGGAEGESKRRWAYTAVLVSAALWEAAGGFDCRYEKWGWIDLDFFQTCRSLGRVETDYVIPVLSLWHPTWKVWAYNGFGEPQCYIDAGMQRRDMWMYRMTLPSSEGLVGAWMTTAPRTLVEVFQCWRRNRLLYETKWPDEREAFRAKYLRQLGADID